MKTRKKTPVPQTEAELEEQIYAIGEIDRSIKELVNRLEGNIEGLKAYTREKVEPLEKDKTALINGIHTYAESNRERLTNGGKRKTVKFSSGQISWHFTKWGISFAKAADVLANIKKKKGLSKFIRTKEEPNKTAMLEDPKNALTIEGVSITRNEEFSIKLPEQNIKVTKTLRTTSMTEELEK